MGNIQLKLIPRIVTYHVNMFGNTLMRNIILIYDFIRAGNCNLINIKFLMLFLPRGVHSECEVLPLMFFGFFVDRYFLGIKPADCTTLPKKHQHTCLNSKGRHGPGRGLNPRPPDNVPYLYLFYCTYQMFSCSLGTNILGNLYFNN